MFKWSQSKPLDLRIGNFRVSSTLKLENGILTDGVKYYFKVVQINETGLGLIDKADISVYNVRGKELAYVKTIKSDSIIKSIAKAHKEINNSLATFYSSDIEIQDYYVQEVENASVVKSNGVEYLVYKDDVYEKVGLIGMEYCILKSKFGTYLLYHNGNIVLQSFDEIRFGFINIVTPYKIHRNKVVLLISNSIYTITGDRIVQIPEDAPIVYWGNCQVAFTFDLHIADNQAFGTTGDKQFECNLNELAEV
jgi:hypothetical protein